MTTPAAWAREQTAGVRITVRVTPRSARSAIEGIRDGALRVRLAAPPVEGAANEALVRFLAEVLGVRRSAVRISSGHRGRTKVVDIDGVTLGEVMRVTASDSQ